MTFYKIVFQDGGLAYVDSDIVEKHHPVFPFGIFGFLKSLTREWKDCLKIDSK